MKTKEELLKRIQKIDEYNAIRGFEWVGHKNESTSPDVLLLDNFKASDNMSNFAIEFAALLKKYGTKIHGVNGMLVAFEFPDAPEKYLGVCPFWRWLQLTDEEMDAKIEEAKLEAEQKAREKAVQEANHSNLYNTVGLVSPCSTNEFPASVNESDTNEEPLDGCDDCCDTEGYDNEYEEEEEYEMYEYDAVGSFIADIEVNVGKIESNEDTIDDDLAQECWDRLLDTLEVDGVEIDNDDDVFETLKFKILEDGTTLVKGKGAECSVRVDIQASCLDEANDERWSAFSKKIRPLNYLKNIREEYVSEAD